jgi:hypothetical protein
MYALTAPKDFIVRGKVYKVLTIILHIIQVTQTTSLLETRSKIIFDIGCDHLAPNMAIILSIHALHLRRLLNSWKQWQQFEQKIFTIFSNKNWTF